jgi:hypothetical protein
MQSISAKEFTISELLDASLDLRQRICAFLKHGYKFHLDDFAALSFHPLIVDIVW